MKLNDLQSKLIAAARTRNPGDGVPYAFEKRIMARLRSAPPINAWSAWGKVLWQAAASCVALTVLCGVWSVSSVKHSDTENFAADFETAVYASVNNHVEDGW